MKLPASTQKIIAELKEAFATSRFDEGLVREGFEEHLELLKLPKRAVVFHPNPVRAILKIYELTGAAAGAAAWAAAWDAAWDAAGAAAWDAAGAAAWAAAGANPWRPFLKIVKGGCLFFWMTRDAVHVAQAQIFSMEHPSGQRRLHYEIGPAIEYRDGSGLWFWKGTQVTEQTILRPETFTAEGILAEQNAEVRRVQIERFGMERFIREANAKIIHSHEMGQLYSLDLPNDPDRKLKAVLVKDPSTNREYFLRVPPTIERADDACAWTFGFEGLEAKNYRPIVET